MINSAYKIAGKEKTPTLYYKLDLIIKKITTISSASLEKHICDLCNNDYKLISLPDMKAFTKQKTKLPDNSFFIALQDTYSYSLRMALPVLIKQNISIIIFLPILVSSNNNKYQENQVQQLNKFIFSEEFKNIFSYTQPISHTTTTI